MLANSQILLRARAVLAAWLWIVVLLRPMAAELDPEVLSPSTPDVPSVRLSEIAPAEADAAKAGPGPSEMISALLPDPAGGVALVPGLPESNKPTQSPKPGFFSQVRLQLAVLPLFVCVLLFVGIAYLARKFNIVSQQLRHANSQLKDTQTQLQRQTHEVTSVQDHLKREVAERRLAHH